MGIKDKVKSLHFRIRWEADFDWTSLLVERMHASSCSLNPTRSILLVNFYQAALYGEQEKSGSKESMILVTLFLHANTSPLVSSIKSIMNKIRNYVLKILHFEYYTLDLFAISATFVCYPHIFSSAKFKFYRYND